MICLEITIKTCVSTSRSYVVDKKNETQVENQP